ncbi:MAG: cardiolipin synthase [Phycisphaeraceae bacterium]|nr:cardiolipin synthase [Phycisphaerales bacterium]MCB9861631.1 cardiolipin synthase [Phycisphaeraceae bacterium]
MNAHFFTIGLFGFAINMAVVYLVIEWAIRVLIVPVIIRKHDTAEAITWLAITLFQPIPGLFIYLLLGNQLLGRRRVKAYRKAIEMVESSPHAKAIEPYTAKREDIEPQHRDLFHLASNVSGTRPLAGNSFRIVQDHGQVVDVLVHDIDQAQYHVHLLTYIFRSDATGARVAEALARAAGRGVRCRVLVDGVGSARMLKGLAHTMRSNGIEVREALPVRPLRRPLQRFDVRNHRKLMVVDGSIAYAGSQNMCDADYGLKRFGPWHDLTARITGPMVQQLQMLFCEDWAAETGNIPQDEGIFPEMQKPDGSIISQSVPSGPATRNEAFRNVIFGAINEANHHIVMVTPYFIPDQATLLALKLRAAAGVKLDIIVPERTNSLLVNAAAKSVFADLLRVGAKIHLHRPGLLHVKAITIDDSIALFGSGNFDRRSFRLNFELNLLLHGRAVTHELRTILESYKESTRMLDIDELNRRPWYQRLADDAASLVAPLL